ncbi:hypothetical protein EYZ11_004399 [Aspergillus tanneri]|uniref:Uncharacterized protein n=1 Tax=Aspergillus tanneri TaxID=1220188 RepID=A0A4S3JL43_9EURO|nr:uncharacterized protein ATNIH1004_006174 [Aspergillus tanneri]KAA8647481.1 hypothetical protein ATNIH1004_006174 [Aspergillus tanneri]THC96125.1 hypothetical protein EYZ11_004399 [Aspergillus tanneri]
MDTLEVELPRRILNRFYPFPNAVLHPHLTAWNLGLALHLACLQDDGERVTQLQLMGASRHALNESGVTVLEVAERMNRVNIIKRLMADVNIAVVGILEMLYAIRRGQATVVRALMEMGVKQQLQDEVLFRGVFVMACTISNVFVVQALLKHGPPLSVAPFEELLVLVARHTNHHEIAEFIHEVSDDERRRTARDTESYSFLGNMFSEENFNRLFDEFIQMPNIPNTHTAEGKQKGGGKDAEA